MPGSARSRKSCLWLVVRMAVASVLLAWLLSGQRGYQVWQILAHLELSPFFFACTLYALAQILSSWRWQWLAQSLEITASLPVLVRLYFVGMFFNLFLPTSMGGDFVRSWLLARGCRCPNFRSALLSVISERFNGLVALLVLGCLATLGALQQLPVWQIVLMWCLFLMAAFSLAALSLVGQYFPAWAKIAQALSVSARCQIVWWRAFVLSIVIQLASILQVWLVANALQLNIPITVLAVVVPITTVASLIPVTVAGLGLREGALMLLLAPVGLPASQAVSLGLAWLAMQGMTSLLGLPLWLCNFETATEATDITAEENVATDEQSQAGLSYVISAQPGDRAHGCVNRGSDQGRKGQSAAAA